MIKAAKSADLVSAAHSGIVRSEHSIYRDQLPFNAEEIGGLCGSLGLVLIKLNQRIRFVFIRISITSMRMRDLVTVFWRFLAKVGSIAIDPVDWHQRWEFLDLETLFE